MASSLSRTPLGASMSGNMFQSPPTMKGRRSAKRASPKRWTRRALSAESPSPMRRYTLASASPPHRPDHSPTHFRNPKIRLKKTRKFPTEVMNMEILRAHKILDALNVFELFSSKKNVFIFRFFHVIWIIEKNVQKRCRLCPIAARKRAIAARQRVNRLRNMPLIFYIFFKRIFGSPRIPEVGW